MHEQASRRSHTQAARLAVAICVAVVGLAASTGAAQAFPAHVFTSSIGGPGSGPGELKEPTGVAVDEVAPGHTGQVYVADTANDRVEWFTPQGAFAGEFDGHETPEGSFAAPTAIAVDNSTASADPSKGDVYIVDSGHDVVDKFDAAGKWIATINTGAAAEPLGELDGVAVDPAGLLWIYQASAQIDSYTSAVQNKFASSLESPFGTAPGFAVDAQDNLYVNRGAEEIGKINEAGEVLVEGFDGPPSTGVAIEKTSSQVFVDNQSTVALFNQPSECTVASPCERAPASSLVERFGEGHLGVGFGVAVDAATGVVYVADHRAGSVQVFTPTLLPVIEGETVTGVRFDGADISVKVDPHGIPTTYRVEYGTTTAYSSSTATVDAGSGAEFVTEHVSLTGLQPATTYHARVVATGSGQATGEDLTLTTGQPLAAGLPDGRAYELVSPNAATNASVYIARPDELLHRDLASLNPFRSTSSGDGVTYAAEAQPTSGSGSTGEGAGDQFVAGRGSAGWSSTDIMPNSNKAKIYEGFSSDLSIGILTGRFEPPLTPSAPAKCNVTYLHVEGAEPFRPAFTEPQTPGSCGRPIYAGISADNSKVLIESEAALTPQSQPGEFGEYNLYASVSGRLFPVSVLPNGQPAVNATFGVSSRFPEGEAVELFGSDFERVISSDGSRIVWTDLNTEVGPENPSGTTRLFIRENVDSSTASTVQVDAAVGGGGQFRGASSDDTQVFFTKAGHLYEYLLESGATEDLTPTGGVVGVAGISEDGSEVYVVAKTVLATNANSQGAKAVAGTCQQAESLSEEEQPGRGCNLYALKIGEVPRYIATLVPHDGNTEGPGGEAGNGAGDWIGSLGLRTAEISQDGTTLAFMSTRSLTGYDNNGVRELYLYTASSQELLCISCNPSGEAADPGDLHKVGAVAKNDPPTPSSPNATYQYRWVSANGNRVFFDSTESLLPQDTNGTGASDVYEWERDGEGSCTSSPSCLYLISDAGSSTEAIFVDASETGDNVFFTTRSDLVSQDKGDNVVLYDARVGGGFPETSTGCTGGGCQVTLQASPAFSAPASTTFTGIGNFPPAPQTQPTHHKTVAELRAESLKKALKACSKKHKKHARAVCERKARRRYGRARKASQPARKTTVVRRIK